MTLARYLADTSALVRLFRDRRARERWDEHVVAGLVAVCPVVELELLYGARSKSDRDELVQLLHQRSAGCRCRSRCSTGRPGHRPR